MSALCPRDVAAGLGSAALGMGAALAHLLHDFDPVPTIRPVAPSFGTLTPSDRTDKTDRTLNVQVSGDPFRQVGRGGPSDKTDTTPHPAILDAADPAGEQLRALAGEHPDATRAQLAQLAGCSVRTVLFQSTGGTA